MSNTDDAPPTVAKQRRMVWTGIAGGTLVSLALWRVLPLYLPEPSGLGRFQIAIGCAAVAALLALVPGIEAISHERLVTAAIDPLAGVETRRMRVNFQYLSNTLEQYVVFAAGLVGLTAYAAPKVLMTATIVWVLARWAFWIGYHRSSLLRAIGAPGMAQSLIVLLYVAFRFTAGAYGQATGVAILVTFTIIEAVLFWAVLHRRHDSAETALRPSASGGQATEN